MITLHIPPVELFNESTSEIITLPGGNFRFEQSLKAIHEWEGRNHRSWLSPKKEKDDLTQEQLIDFIKCMCLDEGFSEYYITKEVLSILMDYMQSNHTASILPNSKDKNPKRITSEYLYAMLAVAQIPFKEVEEWEIGRVFALLYFIGYLNDPKGKNRPKKSKKELARNYSKINAQRRAAAGLGGHSK